MSEDTTDWTELREFKGVDLAKSYVLSWETESGSLLIDTDLLLCPEHPFYEKPRPAEKDCFRPAFIEFPYCTGIAAGGDRQSRPAKASLRALSGGRIAGLTRIGEGLYEISGKFGTVTIAAERPMVRLKNTFV